MTDRYAVFGNPVAHSKSPLIHSLFAKQTKQDITYDKQLVPLDGFAEAAKKFFAEGGSGLNITVPFKLDAFAFADVRSERAELAGAVNTLKRMPDSKIYGDNTDGAGMVRDITQNLGWTIKGKNILVLGAGGAVRGVINPLLAGCPQRLVIANRTADKAQELAALAKSVSVSGCGYDAVRGVFDVVINGTSASLANELPALNPACLSAATACYDMMYAKTPTAFLVWAKHQGCSRVADGLGMLTEQAAESFYLWRGVRPDTGPVIKELRQQL